MVIRFFFYLPIFFSGNAKQRLLESAEPGRADHKLLVKANRRIDTVMLMAQKISGKSSIAADPSSSPSSSSKAHTKPLPIVTPIQTDMTSVRSEFITFDTCKLDCSQIVDLFSGAPMVCIYFFFYHDGRKKRNIEKGEGLDREKKLKKVRDSFFGFLGVAYVYVNSDFVFLFLFP